jgi:chromosome segregation ATPase
VYALRHPPKSAGEFPKDSAAQEKEMDDEDELERAIDSVLKSLETLRDRAEQFKKNLSASAERVDMTFEERIAHTDEQIARTKKCLEALADKYVEFARVMTIIWESERELI